MPKKLVNYLKFSRAMKEWGERDFLEHSPQLVKQRVFEKYGIKNAIWIETGTFLCTTTDFLRKRYPHVHSIEPSREFFDAAVERLGGLNVTFYNDVSENILPQLLPVLKGDINFWLDGHYSAGLTFRGLKDCPVEDELNAIGANIDNFRKISILIDDVRCFVPSGSEYSSYPSINYLVDWARSHGMCWRIEHDILIMQRD
tara:strand:- start:150 stop:749 length:600 start_codon:yes stop_codon:yes gene_type:complete